ncbi:MAG: helix-turn-helix transcriptional regulator [Fimbriimonas sp.]
MPEILIGAELQALRLGRGLSLSALASRAGIAKSTLSDWEKGKKQPGPEHLQKVLESLRADPAAMSRLVLSLPGNVLPTPLPYGAPVSLGQILRAIRSREKRTQAGVAELAGVRQSAVAKWESGESQISSDSKARILQAFGASESEIGAILGMTMDDPLDEEDIFGRIAAIDMLPAVVQEIAYLALEREMWFRAMIRPSEFGLVLMVASIRANIYYFEGRPQALMPLSRQILSLTRSYGHWDEGSLSYFSAQLSHWLGRELERDVLRHRMERYIAQMKDERLRLYLASYFATSTEALRYKGRVEEVMGPFRSIYHRVLPYELSIHAATTARTVEDDPERAIEILLPYARAAPDISGGYLSEPFHSHLFESAIMAGYVPPGFDEHFASLDRIKQLPKVVMRWDRMAVRIERLRSRGAPVLQI